MTRETNANVIHEAILIGYLKSTAASPANSDIRYTVVLFDLLSISSFSYSIPLLFSMYFNQPRLSSFIVVLKFGQQTHFHFVTAIVL